MQSNASSICTKFISLEITQNIFRKLYMKQTELIKSRVLANEYGFSLIHVKQTSFRRKITAQTEHVRNRIYYALNIKDTNCISKLVIKHLI